MIPHTFSALTALSMALLAAPAVAQNAGKDVRCMMLSQAFSKLEKDPAKKQIATANALYYFGRVDVQLSGSALRKEFIAQNTVIKQQNAGQAMTACAKDFNARQQALRRSVQGAVVNMSPKE